MTHFVTKPALLWVSWAIAGRVTLNTTRIASAGKGTLDTLIRTVGRVVTNLPAVEAFASEAASVKLIGTLSSKVTGLVVAIDELSLIRGHVRLP
jgi:hypothetical protein